MFWFQIHWRFFNAIFSSLEYILVNRLYWWSNRDRVHEETQDLGQELFAMIWQNKSNKVEVLHTLQKPPQGKTNNKNSVKSLDTNLISLELLVAVFCDRSEPKLCCSRFPRSHFNFLSTGTSSCEVSVLKKIKGRNWWDHAWANEL